VTVRPGMNDLLPCGSETARRRHRALAEGCEACGVEGRRDRRMSLAEVIAFRQRQRELQANWGDAA
jgi:hypothetical protein